MPRRGDHIRKRKDNRWEGRYPCGTRTSGTVVYRSVYGKSYTECKEKLEKMRKEHFNFCSAVSEFSYSAVLYRWLEANQIRLKGATVNKYYYMAESHILPALGAIKISEITSDVINTFLSYKLKQGSKAEGRALSPSYVRTMAVLIEASIKYAASEGLCPPLRTPVHKPVLRKKEPSIIPYAVEACFVKMLDSKYSKEALGSLIALHTGMRIGEICALRWENINFRDDIIYVSHTISRVRSEDDGKTMLIIDSPKTETSRRQIPISSVLRPFLSDAYQKRESTFVVSPNERFVGPRTFDYRFRQMLKKIRSVLSIFTPSVIPSPRDA